jgi:hypothetical protein
LSVRLSVDGNGSFWHAPQSILLLCGSSSLACHADGLLFCYSAALAALPYYCGNSCLDALSQINNLGSKTNHQCKSTNTSHADTLSCTPAEDKHNTSTPESGAKPSPIQRQKKTVPGGNQQHCETSSIRHGHVLAIQPKIGMDKIFPRDIPEKACIQFCCRGRECKKKLETACPFLHPCSPEDLKVTKCPEPCWC